jgi:ribosomal protein S18 acetylase RimI-like enzyme
MAEWQIVPFSRTHDRADFSCGKAALDTFLRSLVTQYEKRHLARTYVAVEPGSNKVAGYFSLAGSQLETSALPEGLKRKLPKHSIPTILLGRLAVDVKFHGQGLGQMLLTDAIHKVLEVSEKAGVFGIDVWAIDDDASAFYRKYGFTPLADHAHHLLLPLKTAEAAARP